jgi:hypothetical protein
VQAEVNKKELRGNIQLYASTGVKKSRILGLLSSLSGIQVIIRRNPAPESSSAAAVQSKID